jgi:subtilase family serine protease
MRRSVVLALLTVAGMASAVVPSAGAAILGGAPQAVQHKLTRSCGDPAPGEVACKAVLDTPVTNTGQVVEQVVTRAIAPSGYGPADLTSAYKLPSATGGSGQTVAVVGAYDNPKAEADLGVYRAQFGLPPCTTANGCFRKVGEFGSGVLPGADSGWAQETSLDLDVVSAVCPNCKIVLVEANDAGLVNIGIAEDVAVFLGATVISNSFVSGSSPFDFLFDFFFYNHPGIPITASSGDNGYGIAYPASSPYVTAVGGTSLVTAGNARGWSETAWSGSGSGCAPFAFKPSWQTDAACGSRTVADVSAVADPRTGVAVYDSFEHDGAEGWMVFGGTSVSAPLIAGVYALAGNGRSLNYASNAYAHREALFDVVSGANGSCGGSYLCTAGVGFDGPTGWGTPNGTGAF